MRVRKLRCIHFSLAAAILAVLPVSAQEKVPQLHTTCTDLSRKVLVPCPDNSKNNNTNNSDKNGKQRPAASVGGQGTLGAKRQSELRRLPANMVRDQKDFWTSPMRLRLADLEWGVPFVGATAGLLVTDTDIEKKLPSSPTTIKRAQDFSKYGVVGFSGLVGGSYLWGRVTHNDLLRRTGLLSGEAAVGTLIATLPVKLVTGRDRPLEGDGTGKFWQGHLSFPSEHSAAAWSIASVFAHEYPSLPVQALVYGGATAMTASRVIGRKHWPSDAFVGAALGWYFGRQIYKRDEELQVGDQKYGRFLPAPSGDRTHSSANMGSPYVPLDSWVYPALERLAAMGYVQTAFMGQRPWTRMESARLLEEINAATRRDPDTDLPDDRRLYEALSREFSVEQAELAGTRNLEATVESVYTRVGTISGTPLEDGYHLGETIINDYGRPFGVGMNAVVGLSGHGAAGPLIFYIRGEFQSAPSAPTPSDSLRRLIANLDAVPTDEVVARGKVARVTLLDSYLGVQLHGLQLTFGKQTLWWGTGASGPFLMSNNAEPIPMFRMSSTTPMRLPLVSRLLGPVRTEIFVGQLAGHRVISTQTGNSSEFVSPVHPQPIILGQKISFKPTQNLELGFSRTGLYGGPGLPITLRGISKALFSTGNAYGREDAGDRRSGFDFWYRVPGVRKWLVLYNDSFTEDEFSPIAYPRRSAMSPGIYMPRVHGLHRVDFRVEAVYTDLPGLQGSGVYYFNDRFRSGYTNRGRLLGSWVGRQGRGIQVGSTLWFAPDKAVRLSYRQLKVSPGFVPEGGLINDFVLSSDWHKSSRISFGTFLQVERWAFPVIASHSNTNVTASVQLTYWPRRK